MLGAMFILSVFATIFAVIYHVFNEHKNKIIKSINEEEKEAYKYKYMRIKLYVKRIYAISLAVGILIACAAQAMENELLTNIGGGFICLGFLCMLLQKFAEPPTTSKPPEE